MKFIPHEYQEYAINRILGQPATGLFLDMGLGKTVITLTAVEQLIYDRFEVSRVLVVAPKRVAEDTWGRESQKWDHLQHLKLSKVLGTARQREAALGAEADIYVINRENVKWLVDRCRKRWPFDMVVLDELSSFKSSKSQRFRALKSVMPLARRVVGLTGTPTPNGLLDLWPQIYLLDRGERLGKTVSGYRERYFIPRRRNGHTVFDWDLKEGAEEAIHEKIQDICVSMSAGDYLQLPGKVMNVIPVKLSPLEMEEYLKLEKKHLLQLDGADIVALAAGAVAGKLLQLANGAAYDPSGEYKVLHSRKLEALEEILDTTGEPTLVFYNYKHDCIRIQERLRRMRPRVLDGADDIQEWNSGRVRLLLAHPASVGHGLNIQEGGHTIVWYGLNWSLELYQQANARLYRQGQGRTVVIHHLVAEGTIDEQVMQALERKDASQKALLEAVKRRKGELGVWE